MRRFTIEDVGEMSEGQLFDRKSAKIKPKDILKHIIAFANADGGALAIGIRERGEGVRRQSGSGSRII